VGRGARRRLRVAVFAAAGGHVDDVVLRATADAQRTVRLVGGAEVARKAKAIQTLSRKPKSLFTNRRGERFAARIAGVDPGVRGADAGPASAL